MKIFNWMQKRLAPNVLKDGVLARNVKKTELIAIDSNTKSLLEEVTFVDILDGWKDGILTIGTFGFDPLTPVTVSETEEVNEKCELLQEIQKFEDEEEEIAPLMFNVSEIGSDSDAITAVDEGEEAALAPLAVKFSASDENTSEIGVDTTKYDEGKLPRKTLAELFLEDSDVKTKKVSPESGKNLSEKTKHGGLSFAKKLIPLFGDQDSRSVKKIQKVMRKMLKRKIHPAVEGNHKSNCLNKEGDLDKAVELVSLLRNPDVAAQASSYRG